MVNGEWYLKKAKNMDDFPFFIFHFSFIKLSIKIPSDYTELRINNCNFIPCTHRGVTSSMTNDK
jgi:hypothetical protein